MVQPLSLLSCKSHAVWCQPLPVHVGYEAWEEHLAIVLGVEVRGLLWSETQPSLLQEVRVMTDGDLQAHGQSM